MSPDTSLKNKYGVHSTFAHYLFFINSILLSESCEQSAACFLRRELVPNRCVLLNSFSLKRAAQDHQSKQRSALINLFVHNQWTQNLLLSCCFDLNLKQTVGYITSRPVLLYCSAHKKKEKKMKRFSFKPYNAQKAITRKYMKRHPEQLFIGIELRINTWTSHIRNRKNREQNNDQTLKSSPYFLSKWLQSVGFFRLFECGCQRRPSLVVLFWSGDLCSFCSPNPSHFQQYRMYQTNHKWGGGWLFLL